MNDLQTKKDSEREPSLGVGTAILIGQVIVNLPALILINIVIYLGFLLAILAQSTFPELARYFWWIVLASLFCAFGIAWLWWALMVPRWRKWAIKKGTPPDKLQKWAVLTGLAWAKGSINKKEP